MTEHQHEFTPGADDHSSLVGGSSAAKRINCPGSYKLEQEIPAGLKNDESAYAAEGTALHECMAYCMENDIVDIADLEGMVFYDHAMTRELLEEAIEPCLTAIDNLMEDCKDEGEFKFLIEKSCAFPGIKGGFGTSDVVFCTDKRSGIIDYKFGAGVPVYAEIVDEWGEEPGEILRGHPNEQLMFYAAAAANTHPEMFKTDPDWPVDLYILQPRIDPLRGSQLSLCMSDVQELNDFADQLKTAVVLCQTMDAGDVPLQTNKGDWCKFCPCKTVCPSHLGPAIDLSALEEAKGTELAVVVETLPDAALENYTEMLSQILYLGEALEPFVKEAAKQATRLLEQDIPVPGHKLVAKRPGHDGWVDAKKAEVYLGRQGVPLDVRRVTKTMTPAAARKALKAMDKTLLETHVKPGVSSGHNLAKGEDPRTEALTTAKVAKALADKLASLT